MISNNQIFDQKYLKHTNFLLLCDFCMNITIALEIMAL